MLALGTGWVPGDPRRRARSAAPERAVRWGIAGWDHLVEATNSRIEPRSTAAGAAPARSGLRVWHAAGSAFGTQLAQATNSRIEPRSTAAGAAPARSGLRARSARRGELRKGLVGRGEQRLQGHLVVVAHVAEAEGAALERAVTV
jgi:hypothetical protein